jgi:hypothetical protein
MEVNLIISTIQLQYSFVDFWPAVRREDWWQIERIGFDGEAAFVGNKSYSSPRDMVMILIVGCTPL